jgi:hypothetical protein
MGSGKRKSDVLGYVPTAESSSAATPASKRTKKNPDTEKRLARFKATCPKNITERVNRVMTQRFFMIERSRTEGEFQEEFKVLGST